MNVKLLGAYGEQTAARYLRVNGYKILAANYRTGVGEIDIVAQKNKIVCFVEVKTRKQGGMFSPADAVDYRKRENIKGSAAAYVNKYGIKNKIRFDIIEVLTDENDDIQSVNHIENAF